MDAEQRSISIRFNMDDMADKELYMKLTKGAGNAISLTCYVKRVLGEYFSLNEEISGRAALPDT